MVATYLSKTEKVVWAMFLNNLDTLFLPLIILGDRMAFLTDTSEVYGHYKGEYVKLPINVSFR